MSERLSPSQRAIFDQIDETTFCSIAHAYRTTLQNGVTEAIAFEAAVAVLSDHFPTKSRRTIVAVTGAVVAHAAPGPLDWFWE
jgi:hypothetical protein